MTRRLTALALAVVALASGPVRADCKLSVMLTLPVTMQGLRPTTVAKINGTDAPFLVDSGAFFSVITPGSAKQFGLRPTPAPPGFFLKGIGGSASVSVATVRQFGIAGASLNNVPFLVGGSEVGQDSGGVIGYNVLGIGDTEYDLAHGMIRLIKPSGCTRDSFPFWTYSGGASVVDIDPGVNARATRIALTVMINGTKVHAVLDSGAAGSVLSRAAAQRAGIDVTAPGAVPSGFSVGFGKRRVQQWTVPVAVFKIGDEEVRQTFLHVIEAIGDGPEAPEMLIGADFFLSHHLYVARDLHKVYVTYNGGNVFNLKAVDTSPPVTAAADAPPARPEHPPPMSRRPPTPSPGAGRRPPRATTTGAPSPT